MIRRQTRITGYIAILAIALQALWPLLAQAKPKNVTLVPVCSEAGVTHYVEMPGASTPLEQRSSSSHEHCSYCSLGGDRLALPAFSQAIFSPDTRQAQPTKTEKPLLKTEEAFLARPRAPPAA